MRTANCVLLSVVALTFFGAMAQTNAHSTGAELTAQIRSQEAVVAQAPGSGDGSAWLKLAVLEQDAARYDDAEHAYEKAARLLKKGDQTLLAVALDRLGTTYVEQGRFSKAEPLERKALALRLQAGDKRAIGTSYAHLAVLEFGKRDLGLAETNAAMAVSLLAPEHTSNASANNATPEEQMSALINLALVRCAKRECAEALPVLYRALSIAQSSYSADSIPVGFLDFLTGYAEWKNGDPRRAAEPMRRGTEELGTQLGWGHPTYVAALRQYEHFLKQMGRMNEAAEVATRLEKFAGANTGEQRAAMGMSLLP
ncbi:MAG TPA: tetratricopeptide repeat protein [Terracidiphilus sp.]|nr:tetratricopeptide repeat protein [Terracidiphilus sp.]